MSICLWKSTFVGWFKYVDQKQDYYSNQNHFIDSMAMLTPN